MKQITEKLLHYASLGVITVVAVWVGWLMLARGNGVSIADRPIRPLAPVATPKSLVAVERLQIEPTEIVATFSGKIRPWETYQVGFEVAGRVESLGENEQGDPLDVGDRVEEGQVLAVLDDRSLRAQRSEASAQVEQAASELDRAERARKNNPSAFSESDVQRFVTDLALARARLDIAVKNLDDAVLRAPVAATISRRLIKPGETIGAHQMVFELVENDRVLLVLNVPESQVRELETRMREIKGAGAAAPSVVSIRDARPNAEDLVFRAHVQLEGKDVYGKPWPMLDGKVYQIAQVADAMTSLFEVEVELDNDDRLLRPGMVATARLVTAVIEGYQVPAASVIYRRGSAYVFTVTEEPAEMELLYWNIGPVTLRRAHRVDLTHWVDQGPHVVVPADSVDLATVVTRGQHRLADGQLVRIVNADRLSPGVTAATASMGAGIER